MRRSHVRSSGCRVGCADVPAVTRPTAMAAMAPRITAWLARSASGRFDPSAPAGCERECSMRADGRWRPVSRGRPRSKCSRRRPPSQSLSSVARKPEDPVADTNVDHGEGERRQAESGCCGCDGECCLRVSGRGCRRSQSPSFAEEETARTAGVLRPRGSGTRDAAASCRATVLRPSGTGAQTLLRFILKRRPSKCSGG
jgi:hypothetical protein